MYAFEPVPWLGLSKLKFAIVGTPDKRCLGSSRSKRAHRLLVPLATLLSAQTPPRPAWIFSTFFWIPRLCRQSPLAIVFHHADRESVRIRLGAECAAGPFDVEVFRMKAAPACVEMTRSLDHRPACKTRRRRNRPSVPTIRMASSTEKARKKFPAAGDANRIDGRMAGVSISRHSRQRFPDGTGQNRGNFSFPSAQPLSVRIIMVDSISNSSTNKHTRAIS